MRRLCAISDKEFFISPHELEFLERIATSFAGTRMEIPLPELSPLERARLRTSHRNEQNLYKAVSARSGHSVISIYPPRTKSPLLSRDEWFQDTWDAQDFAENYNLTDPFFDQFLRLQEQVPRAATVTLNNDNCDYTTGTAYCKNCYLINSSEHCQDCYYSKLLQDCRDVVDSAYCYDCELLYECFNVRNCYNCKWVYNSQQVSDSYFCDDLRNCQNCFLCTNLVGKQYYYLNQKLAPQDYRNRVNAALSSSNEWRTALAKFDEIRLKRWHKYAEIVNCEDCSGDFLRNSKNCKQCYDVVDSRDCTYVQVGIKVSDLVDCSNMYLGPELSYQVLGTIGTRNVHFSLYVFHSSDMWYCEQCFSCKNCFGCVGLRNKQYCILNRQYDRDSYEIHVSRLLQHMIRCNEWGKFIPISLSPFAYNKSLANEYFPLSKDEAIRRDYSWEDPVHSDHLPATASAGQSAKEVSDNICKEILSCAQSGKNYRIQMGELAFYRRMDLPIPSLCPDVRYRLRMQLRNPRELREGRCSICSEAVRTNLPETLQAKVLCERDYLRLVS